MPYLYETVKSPNVVERATAPPPFGPGFSEEWARRADKMEIWCSSIKELGPDYTDFVLFANDKEINRQRIEGY